MNANIKPTEPNGTRAGGPMPSGGADEENNSALSNYRASNQIDDALAFDLLENPQNWPDDPKIQSELAELLEIHLAMRAHADDLEPALTNVKISKRIATAWMLSAAAILLAVLPAAYVVSRTREARRMQANGAALAAVLQERIQAEFWSDFFEGSLDLLKRVKMSARYCDPAHEDRSEEVEQARRLYAMGISLPLDGLNNPETISAKNDLQNWLTEVSANDTCMTPERSHELLALAKEMDLEGKVKKLDLRLRGVES